MTDLYTGSWRDIAVGCGLSTHVKCNILCHGAVDLCFITDERRNIKWLYFILSPCVHSELKTEEGLTDSKKTVHASMLRQAGWVLRNPLKDKGMLVKRYAALKWPARDSYRCYMLCFPFQHGFDAHSRLQTRDLWLQLNFVVCSSFSTPDSTFTSDDPDVRLRRTFSPSDCRMTSYDGIDIHTKSR